jgi:hypothetical protein
MRYLILFILSCFISTSVSAQVFFKQRVYGNEKREKNTLSEVEVDNSYEVTKVKIKGEKYRLFNTYTTEWKEQPIQFDASKGRFYLEKSKKAIHWRVGRRLLKDLGEKEILNSLDRSRVGVVTGRFVQGFSVMATLTVLPLLATEPTSTLIGIGALGGIWFGGRTLVRFSRAGVKKRLIEYNSRFENTEKNFYQNFQPSSITFKPIQISPFTPSLAPTLGISWKL